ncbi:hypothetical protein D3C72_2326000 [compost metagenome]
MRVLEVHQAVAQFQAGVVGQFGLVADIAVERVLLAVDARCIVGIIGAEFHPIDAENPVDLALIELALFRI